MRPFGWMRRLTLNLLGATDEMNRCRNELAACQRRLAENEKALKKYKVHLPRLRREHERDQDRIESALDRLKHERACRKQLGWALLTGETCLKRRPDAPESNSALLQTFQSFRDNAFRALAWVIAQETETLSGPGWQIALTEEIFRHGAPRFLESLLGSDLTYRAALKEHVANAVLKIDDTIKYHTSKKMSSDLSAALAEVVEAGLQLAWDILSAPAPGGLIWAKPREQFSPQRHQALFGRPDGEAVHGHAIEEITVTGTLFPGYLVFGAPPIVAEKCTVFTQVGDRNRLVQKH